MVKKFPNFYENNHMDNTDAHVESKSSLIKYFMATQHTFLKVRKSVTLINFSSSINSFNHPFPPKILLSIRPGC